MRDWTDLRERWELRDQRYSMLRYRITLEQIDAVRALRTKEANELTFEPDREEALRDVRNWYPGHMPDRPTPALARRH